MGRTLFPVHLSCRRSSKALAMLSGMSIPPGVTSRSYSPGSWREGFTPCCSGRDDPSLVSTGSVEHPGSFPRVDGPIASVVLLEGAGFFSCSATNGLGSAVVGAVEFPAVDVRLVPRLDTVNEECLETLLFFSWTTRALPTLLTV